MYNMRTCLFICVPFVLASCGNDISTPEGLAAEQLTVMQEVAAAAGEVKDAEKATLAVFIDKMEALTRRQRKLAAAADAMSEAQRQEVLEGSAKYKAEAKAAGEAFAKGMAAISELVKIDDHKTLKNTMASFAEAYRQTSENLKGRY